jgi:hypothetical protein
VKQFARLMDETAVHSIVSQLEQSFEQFSRDLKLGDRIEFVGHASKRAAEYGFREHSDIVAWCMGALMGGENFHTSPLVADAIAPASRDSSKLFNFFPISLMSSGGVYDRLPWQWLRN